MWDWKKDENSPCKSSMVPNAYKRTLIAARCSSTDNTIIWIEGAEFESPISSKSGDNTNYAASYLNTNSGFIFTKENLQKIVDNMPDDGSSRMIVAGCGTLDIATIKKKFEDSNNMVQVAYNAFQPKQNKGK